MNKITKVTRKWILLDLIGVENIEEIILSFFKADDLPSTDSRYKNMTWDFYQHRRNNLDWEDDWFIEDDRLNFYWISDIIFLEFICFVIHPENIHDNEIIKSLLKDFNNKLIRDWFEVKTSWKKVSWMPLFKWYEILWGNKKIYFYTGKYKWNKKFPHVMLLYNNWDDFWWRTTFSAYYYSSEKKEINLWRIKILEDKENNQLTNIPDYFVKLTRKYCSIFSTDEWFKTLDSEEIRKYKRTILEWLNEVTYNKTLLSKFRRVSWFWTSLLRESEAYARVQNIETTLLSFWLNNENWDILFDFEKSDIPFRINTLIWKNWCWKTTLLSTIAKELVEHNPFQTKLTTRPSFLKIIQVSYSVFDNFLIPSDKEDSKYIYCWLRDEDNQIDMLSLQKRLSLSLKVIKEKWKGSIFTYLLRDILDEDNIIFEKLWESYIEENSLILFDEPETHLHPNMIFKLLKAMYTLLDDNNSYLIIATHSPIILQQIPSRYVQIIDNFWNRWLRIESFWENFSELTKEVFWNYEEDDIIYKDVLKKLVNKENFSEEKILDLFDNGLSLNARIYLKTLVNIKENEKNQ